jgi:hypothetical protein
MKARDLGSMATEAIIEANKLVEAVQAGRFFEAAGHGERIKDLGKTLEAVSWFLHRQACDQAGTDPYDVPTQKENAS